MPPSDQRADIPNKETQPPRHDQNIPTSHQSRPTTGQASQPSTEPSRSNAATNISQQSSVDDHEQHLRPTSAETADTTTIPAKSGDAMPAAQETALARLPSVDELSRSNDQCNNNTNTTMTDPMTHAQQAHHLTDIEQHDRPSHLEKQQGSDLSLISACNDNDEKVQSGEEDVLEEPPVDGEPSHRSRVSFYYTPRNRTSVLDHSSSPGSDANLSVNRLQLKEDSYAAYSPPPPAFQRSRFASVPLKQGRLNIDAASVSSPETKDIPSPSRQQNTHRHWFRSERDQRSKEAPAALPSRASRWAQSLTTKRSRSITIAMLSRRNLHRQMNTLQVDPSLFTPFELSPAQILTLKERSEQPSDTTDAATKFTHTYPDISRIRRRPPILEHERRFKSSHKGSLHAIAACGEEVVLGTHQLRLWNTNTGDCHPVLENMIPSDGSVKVRALGFAPLCRPNDSGRILWVGLQDGSLTVVNMETGETLGKRMATHRNAVSFILRYRNTELWTIDEAGVLNIWPVLSAAHQNGDKPYNPLDITIQRHQVAVAAHTALIIGSDLWMSSGRILDVFQRQGKNMSKSPHVRILGDLGNITQLASVPCHKNRLFAAHDDGKISIWSTDTVERIQYLVVSETSLCSMVVVGDQYLWIGDGKGVITVYDTASDPWVAVKSWKAHEGSVTHMMVDDSGYARDEVTTQVISTDTNGCIAVWDALLSEDWQEQELGQYIDYYCKYRDVKIKVSSWNVDAVKPDKLEDADHKAIKQWLGDLDDPDIIIIGIQEIVDLESKKNTARTLLRGSRKKEMTVKESDELLTHRYLKWHDYLTEVVNQNYGADNYCTIKTDQLIGLFSIVIVKKKDIPRIFHCDSTVVKTGIKLMNKVLYGNKGGVAIRLLFDHTSFCFVNCHLAAGQHRVAERNADANGILHTARFPDHPNYLDIFGNGGDGSQILDHEYCFFSGDLNYRIEMQREDVLRQLESEDLSKAREALLREDQLNQQRTGNPLFPLLLFKEAPIQFNPTYKYEPGTETYDTSEKQRIPAWCDRILFRTPESTENLFYRRYGVTASDHRPISAAFLAKVKVIDDTRRDEVQEKVKTDWEHHIAKVLQKKKLQYLWNYDLCDMHEAYQRLTAARWNMQEALSALLVEKIPS